MLLSLLDFSWKVQIVNMRLARILYPGVLAVEPTGVIRPAVD